MAEFQQEYYTPYGYFPSLDYVIAYVTIDDNEIKVTAEMARSISFGGQVKEMLDGIVAVADVK